MKTLAISLRGIVQGVGFRPFVARAAAACGIRGSVANRGSHVAVLAQGEDAALARFLDILKREAPPRALVMSLTTTEIEAPVAADFAIVESEREAGDIFVSPDIGICGRCLEELFDPEDPRYRHPFINCTACGPRLSILDAMPYDRERTSMSVFPMCPDCAREYHDPKSRRYDAQPVCCPNCGPELVLLDSDLRGLAALSEARRRIMAGEIVAVKGIGGFHLACDATNNAALSRLRRLKERPVKPFAVMVRDMDVARREVVLDAAREELLDSWQKPIVLCPRRADNPEARLSPLIAPDNPTVGLMLPYTPLHHLLFRLPEDDVATMTTMTDMLVMTSANAASAPICKDEDEARREIAGFCDAILSHNREIRIRADDSVVDVHAGAPAMIRRSRGYAPLPCLLENVGGLPWPGQALGMGGELKNTFCLARNGLFYLSPHVGDLGDPRAEAALLATLTRLEELLEMRPELVVCDPHPGYISGRLARELAEQRGIPLVTAQHHFAHIASCMAENGVSERVLGLAFDGTGYGTDGSIWGGEFLLADFTGFERAAHIRPFWLPGGDAAAREGWRPAAAMLLEYAGAEADELIQGLSLCKPEEAAFLRGMIAARLNCARSTSMGRLFDAAAAILGLCRVSTFEGEAAMRLQFAAEALLSGLPREKQTDALLRAAEGVSGPFLDVSGETLVLPTERLLVDLARARLSGTDAGTLALRFHAELLAMIRATCAHIRGTSGISICALSGGVFQNRLLATACGRMLEADGWRVLRHRLVPANDGGLALGQAVIGAWRLRAGAGSAATALQRS